MVSATVFAAVAACLLVAVPMAAGTCPAAELDGLKLAYNNNGLDLYSEDDFETWACKAKSLGSHKPRLAEASDAMDDTDLIVDGRDGNTNFQFGNLKTMLTIGEYDKKTGYVPVGVADGQGVMKVDKRTLRLVVQAESYGHIAGYPSWYFPVNEGAAEFTGSHVSYIDYRINGLKNKLMQTKKPASRYVKGAGSLIEYAFNLAGVAVGPAAIESDAPHYGDTSASGVYVSYSGEDSLYRGTVWTYHSFCSAHLEEKRQWGDNIGLNDDIFLTVEEWTSVDEALVTEHGFVGLSAHAIDMDKKTAWAVGAFGMGGYEKIVEVNCGTPHYVCFAVSGYNGAFNGASDAMVARRKAAYGDTRTDGEEWVFTQNIVPARLYVGVKGYTAKGTPCYNECTFLESNGLAYGKTYGFSVPEATADRDPYHVDAARGAVNEGVPLEGVFAPTAWMWDGVVKDFEHDLAWHFQEAPLNVDGYKFWTAQGSSTSGYKTEHLSPDPRGNNRFIQGSTAGYMGFYSFDGVADILGALTVGEFPDSIPGKYDLFEGETDISARIVLSGEGKTSVDGLLQDKNWDSGAETNEGAGKSTFEDIDGLEWFAAADDRDFIIIQEDSGNDFGERMFMAEIPKLAETLPIYYFVAQAGGSANTRNMAEVCIPKDTWNYATSSEFSGASDMSGVLTQKKMGGYARRAAEAEIPINEKLIAVGLQHSSCAMGVISALVLTAVARCTPTSPTFPTSPSRVTQSAALLS